MKIRVYDGCYTHSIKVSDSNMMNAKCETDLKKIAMNRIIEKIDDKEQLDGIMKDLLYYVKPIYGEYNNCDQCGDKNTYEEFEI